MLQIIFDCLATRKIRGCTARSHFWVCKGCSFASSVLDLLSFNFQFPASFLKEGNGEVKRRRAISYGMKFQRVGRSCTPFRASLNRRLLAICDVACVTHHKAQWRKFIGVLAVLMSCISYMKTSLAWGRGKRAESISSLFSSYWKLFGSTWKWIRVHINCSAILRPGICIKGQLPL